MKFRKDVMWSHSNKRVFFVCVYRNSALMSVYNDFDVQDFNDMRFRKPIKWLRRNKSIRWMFADYKWLYIRGVKE